MSGLGQAIGYSGSGKSARLTKGRFKLKELVVDVAHLCKDAPNITWIIPNKGIPQHPSAAVSASLMSQKGVSQAESCKA